MLLLRLILCCLLCLLPTLAHTKIVFKSKRAATGGERLYVMDDDGRNVQQITDYSALWPVWSPDGKQIAFLKSLPVERRQPQQFAVFIINSDGSNLHRLTDDHEDDLNGGRLFEGAPSWSPDGHRIAFTSARATKPGTSGKEIYTMDLTTKKMRRLTRRESLKTSVSWSPDGRYIAYRDDALIRGFPTIFVMRADGSGQRELVKADMFHFRYGPRWSPDSQSVVYDEDNFGPGGGGQVVIHNIKTDKRQVVDTPDNWDVHGACFMGSKHLLISAKGFNGTPDKYEIYRYHLVTGEIVNLTNTPGNDYAMDWIDDDVLSVSPKDKKKVTWGEIKQ
ncbi:MAG: hypothetical protein OXI67_06565 [Candidatus Poribacteria bacterium]|nr:hypothetical protein [Candidatus Poribacteria bacterium]